MHEGEFDYKESALPKDEQARLNALRMIQMERGFTSEELDEFRSLTSEKTVLPATEGEEQEYLALSREQIESTNWTPEKAKRMLELTKKLGK